MNQNDLSIKESSITFCGLFTFGAQEFENIFTSDEFIEYENIPDTVKSFTYFRSIYYPNFCKSIISKKIHSNNDNSVRSFRHIFLKDVVQFHDLKLMSEEGEEIMFKITKAELFLFRDHTSIHKSEMLGIYSFTTQVCEAAMSLNLISNYINKLRLLTSNNKIFIAGNRLTTLQFIEKHIVYRKLSRDFITSIMGNKLKTYSITNLNNDVKDFKNLLFDLATASPIRMDQEYSYFEPSEEYSDYIFDRDLISVFKNWHALTLFDSFTVLGSRMENLSLTWENTYFFIYIHCLRIKFYLFRINAELSDISSLGRNSKKVRDSFVEYISTNNFSFISYNFLPNIIYQKMHQSLEIQDEVTYLEQKISNISLMFREAMDKRLNNILLLVALLTLSTSILDTSTLMIKLTSSSEEIFYPFSGAMLTGLILSFIFIYLLFAKIRSKRRI
jgi:hypothetical protein